ncbi:hypothetical protein S83_050233 [Arachis hypogaea]|nr:uncharacterized protein DS421_15g491430 [Arachis hypogaea]
MISDRDAMRMGRLLVSQTVKHCSIYVVDGCKKSNSVEITSNDEDYVPIEASGLIEVEVEGESESSSEEDKFDNSGFAAANGDNGGGSTAVNGDNAAFINLQVLLM